MPDAEPIPADPPVTFPYVNAEQQRNAATFGMWIFLTTEMLLFGPLFLAYTVYSYKDPAGFDAAGAHTLLGPGTLNTALLLLSSFLVANAVAGCQRRPKHAGRLFIMAAGIGLLFLAIKVAEYGREIHEHLFPGPAFHAPGASEMFFVLYFITTALHAVHVAIGTGLLATWGLRLRLASEPAPLTAAIPLIGLYEHFVTFIWLFVYALFYLATRA